MADKNIPYGHQWIDDDDIQEVVKVLKTDWVTQGPKVTEFEEKIAAFCGAKYGVAFSSGTAALHGAYNAAGIKSGDEVITTPLTFAATSNAIFHLGGKPVFVDVLPGTFNINPEEVEKKITGRTKAIAVVDFAGHPCDYDEIKKIAKKHKLLLIEDACHALGAEYKGKKIGSLSDMTILSFHPVKHIATGEGGMVLTDNEKFYEKLKIFRNHGIVKKPEKGGWYYEIAEPGFNYRLTDMQCALGLSQLKKIDKFLARRREIVARYNEAFKDVPEIILPAEREYVKSGWHLYIIQLNLPRLKAGRREIFEAFHKNKIGVQVHYMPLHMHPFYQKEFGYKKGDFPAAEAYYERAISIPLFPKMTDEDVDRVIETTKSIINDFKAGNMASNSQEEQWAGKFGDDYLGRNPKSIGEMDELYVKNHGFTRTSLTEEFLNKLDRSIRILEVGCNCGVQLMILKKMGFENLYGVEINQKTLESARLLDNTFNLVQGSALDLPFKDGYFDMVFTSGVLIHIAPENLEKVMEEIYRCSNKYIWGFEFYNNEHVEINYRGNKNLHWKGDFAKNYIDNFKDLKLVKEKKMKYLDNENIDTMFLLEKNG